MTLIKKIGLVFILPVVWISAVINRRRPMEVRYRKLQKWSIFAIRYLGYTLEVEGSENIPFDEPVLFVSNHQGTLDPALIIASVAEPMSFISKQENKKYFAFGTWAVTIGVIFFDRDSREGNIYMLRETARRLKAGGRLLIFPEGTRSRGDKMNQFKAGALQPAYLTKSTIVPITLNNSYSMMEKNSGSKKLKVTFGTPRCFEEYQKYSYEELSDIIFSEIQEKIIPKSKMQ